MKILSKDKIRAWDKYTIESNGIDSFALMLEASRTFCRWFKSNFVEQSPPILVFCGPGNNGGDGFCISSILSKDGYEVSTYLCSFGARISVDNKMAQKLCESFDILENSDLPLIPENSIVIDALFGSGISGPLRADYHKVTAAINNSASTVVSVDIPSGLDPDIYSTSLSINADFCLSFEVPKLSFFYHEHFERIKKWSFAEIGLSPSYIRDVYTDNFFISRDLVSDKIKTRSPIASKISFGFGQLTGGSRGMFGAVILAARSAMRTGMGRLLVNLPERYEGNLISAVPEVMSMAPLGDEKEYKYKLANKNINAVALGPGLGNSKAAISCIDSMLNKRPRNCVLDADALNIIARNQWQNRFPVDAIITPHQYEFERLFGKSKNHFERIKRQREMAMEHRIFIVLKGRHTTICTPNGECYFNATGNVGMATAGSGDVLLGMILSFLGQGNSPLDASLLAVYCHGLAGDLARDRYGEVSMIASDIVECIPIVINELYEEG